MTADSYIREYAAHAAAIEYIRQALAEGNTLSRYLLESLDLDAGSVAAISAVPLDAGEILEFRSGHARPADTVPQRFVSERTAYLAYPKPTARTRLAESIRTATEPGYLCLLESAVAHAGDACLARAKSLLIFHGVEVYHALLGVDRGETSPEDAIREAESLPTFVGAVGRPPWPAGTDACPASVTDQDLKRFAQTARCVFVGAYDGEGYLVWRKQPSN